MSKKVVLIHPFDPLGNKVGGIESFIKGFIRCAPNELDIAHIGTTSVPSIRPIHVWQNIKLGDNIFKSYPILYKKDENTKKFIPESLQFTVSLFRFCPNLSGKVILFHRLEPAVAFIGSSHKKIAFVHDDVEALLKRGTDSYWRYAPWLYNFMQKKIIESLDYIFAINTKTVDIYRRNYPSLLDRISFLPTWVDQNVFSISNKPKYSLRKEIMSLKDLSYNNSWVLFVGRLKEQKAPLKVIKSFYEYSKLNPKSDLLIIGEGNLYNHMVRDANRLDILSQVHFLGYKTQEELIKFYQASDVLLMTSNYESMPMCCLEALGSGLPVVSTNVGEINRVVRNGFSGEVVDDFSCKSIARAIYKVTLHPQKYNKDNCFDSISEYTPKKVLSSVYEFIVNI